MPSKRLATNSSQILRLARRHGVIRPRDLAEPGIPRTALQRLVESGAIDAEGEASTSLPARIWERSRASSRRVVAFPGASCACSRPSNFTTSPRIPPVKCGWRFPPKPGVPETPACRCASSFCPARRSTPASRNENRRGRDSSVQSRQDGRRLFQIQKQGRDGRGSGGASRRLAGAAVPHGGAYRRGKGLPGMAHHAAVYGAARSMTRKPVKDLAASIRQRLQNLESLRQDFQYVLIRYASERLLYRLSRSPYRDRFVLKGAMLFVVWSGDRARPTRDVTCWDTARQIQRHCGEHSEISPL